MEDASETSYWCHMCSQSVNPVIEGEIVNCNLCQGGFVEEMENGTDLGNNDDHAQATESLWAPILIGMMNTMNNRGSESNVEREDDSDDEEGGDDGGDQENDGVIDLARQLEEITSRRRSHSAQILDLLQGIRSGLVVESESNEANPDNEENSYNELVVLIDSFNQRVRIHDSDADSVPSGSLGDYFIGPGFELLLQRLAESDLNNRYGTPPATKEAVEALGTVKIDESLLQCTVCLDDFEIGVEAKEMPCKHKFHRDCLLPWLELHSSCPVCRFQLPTADDDGEPKADAETLLDNADISIASVEGNGSMEGNGSSLDSSLNNSSAN